MKVFLKAWLIACVIAYLIFVPSCLILVSTGYAMGSFEDDPGSLERFWKASVSVAAMLLWVGIMSIVIEKVGERIFKNKSNGIA